MGRFFAVCMVVILLGLGLSHRVGAEDYKGLKVIIGDVWSRDGTLRLFVHTEKTYPTEEEAVHFEELRAKEGDIIHYLRDLPKGRYAVVVHHDMDDDKDFNTNQFGMAEEGIGYSNDPRLDFGMPEFQDVWFDYDGDGGYVIVPMVY